MIDPSEVQLEKTTSPVPASPLARSSAPWLVGALALLVGIVAIWFFLNREEPQPAPESAATSIAPAPLATTPGPGSICGTTDEIALPPLGESDGLAGTLASTLSAHPRVTAWLTTDGLIRRFVVVVDIIASGKSPVAQLGSLRPSGTFRSMAGPNGLTIDPRNYERYADIADAVNSVDAQAAVRVCSALKPRLDEAYAELGTDRSFDSALEQAIVTLLQTPALGTNVRLVRREATFLFEDPALESLAPAQKHLMRMGPAHARVIQDKLRQIALAIGIPGTRLPS